MKSYFFWDITPCIPLKDCGRFEEHVASIFRVEEEEGNKQSSTLSLTLKMD
jgi:hypothetical protein